MSSIHTSFSQKPKVSLKDDIVNTLVKSVFGGLLIGFACIISSKYTHPELIFPVGLVCILYSRSLLFTGCVGHMKYNDYHIYLILLGNIVGCAICLIASKFGDISVMQSIGHSKYTQSLLQCLVSSILCGMLMCVATSLNKNKNLLCVFICVAGFIICGLDHSIANIFYIMCCKFDIKSLMILLTCILGNSIGARLLYLSSNLRVNAK